MKEYKVIVVDDEPTGLNHVCMILEKKCPEFKVIGRADNGMTALLAIEKEQPDVLITDVRMPVMDGIGLVSQVKKLYPEIVSVIVSGYSEFEYAKNALRVGVSDYLLKPLTAVELQTTMKSLMGRLETLYYQKRNVLLKTMCKGELPPLEQLERYFPKGRYYSVIIREQGLPRRFSYKAGVEVFAMKEERIYVYGRDEMESLILCPRELGSENNLKEHVEKLVYGTKKPGAYVTAVMASKAFTLSDFPEIAGQLYKRLDEVLIIGMNQLKYLDDVLEYKKGENSSEREMLDEIGFAVRYKEHKKVAGKLEGLFGLWEQEHYGQLYVESKLKHLFHLILNNWQQGQEVVEVEYALDDAFYYATDMEELKENILSVLKLSTSHFEEIDKDDKEQLFGQIISYLNGNMHKTLSIGSVCREFGVSQTTLSKMFRNYLDSSFSNYLTGIRIAEAQEIMKRIPHAFIKDIAEQVGYQDQFYFSRVFRAVAGIAPKEYMDGLE